MLGATSVCTQPEEHIISGAKDLALSDPSACKYRRGGQSVRLYVGGIRIWTDTTHKHAIWLARCMKHTVGGYIQQKDCTRGVALGACNDEG